MSDKIEIELYANLNHLTVEANEEPNITFQNGADHNLYLKDCIKVELVGRYNNVHANNVHEFIFRENTFIKNLIFEKPTLIKFLGEIIHSTNIPTGKFIENIEYIHK